ncbi:ABC transporter permease [Anaerorhabdus sp.]|uniref:ABC transporter permease n=1 Tax=Anaerorhabdus sp. TaxID=1872524 RepID=UPI002FCA4459
MNKIIKKILQALLTMFLVSLIIYLMFEIIPGDPILAKLGEVSDPALEASLRLQYGLDKSGIERYFIWIMGIFRGDLGTSIRFNVPVNELIGSRLINTFSLAMFSMVLIVCIGIPVGILIAKNSKKTSGFIFNMLTQLGTSIPSFFLAIVLILIFSIQLKWFNVISFVPITEGILPFLKGLVLPSVAIAIGSIATVARYTRTSVLEEMSMDYVKTAKNKGISNNGILYRHVLPNTLVRVITIIGLTVSSILGGAIVIESVFSIPGIGSLLHVAIKSRDLPLVQGISLYITFVVVIIFMILDILYVAIDPRMTVEGGK